MFTREAFLDHLRDALNHLNDPDRLCQSPLAELFGVAGRLDTYSAMQDILTNGIAVLRPEPSVPASARAWRIYDLLTCRYVQELTVPQVAHQLGVSERQLHREQRAALDALAGRLRERFGVETMPPAPAEVTETVPAAKGNTAGLGQELAWLRNVPPAAPTEFLTAVQAAVKLTEPVADLHRVTLDVDVPPQMPAVAVHPVGLQQVLLYLLSVAIHRALGGRVRVTARPLDWDVALELCSECPSGKSVPPLSSGDALALEAAQQLADLCSVRMTCAADGECFDAQVILPTQRQVTVLAVDDNADTLRLLEHYAVGTRYRVVGLMDPNQALETAQALVPQVIVLDVMMPQMDGWRLLGRLHEHPSTRHIPVIVCTILPHEELALTLGAAAYVRKPVTQEAFLAALDQKVALRARGSR